MKEILIRDIIIGGTAPVALIAGPCVIEDESLTLEIAAALKEMTSSLGIPFIFKASFDKANRTSVGSPRGPGLTEGLKVLKKIKEDIGVPVLTDVHCKTEVAPVAEVVDVIQIPALLCRQTDLLIEAGRSGLPVNIKKGQFVAPADISKAARKVESTGNEKVFITERGTSFGYNNLIVDMRGLPIIRKSGYPVVFDATHSVQLPSSAGGVSGGDREMAPYLARAAVAAGVDALFMEVHPDPGRALCDGPNSIDLKDLPALLKVLKEIDALVTSSGARDIPV